MKLHDYLNIIPPQYTGNEIESIAEEEFENEEDARNMFITAKQRLLDVNNWNRIAGIVTATFQVIDNKGKEVDRQVKKSDYLRISIPGPGNKEGEGYDWVFVEDLIEFEKEGIQSTGFRVRPNENPFSVKNETAHFYSNEATSSFIITRDKLKVSSWIIDRNLLPNTEAESLVDKVRDIVVGVSAIAGFSKLQWQALAEGLIKK